MRTNGVHKATRRRRKPFRLGLACAGGVVEGALYEIGALCALEDAIEGLDFCAADVYVGVSSGSLVASMLANGVSPRTMSRAVLGEASPELNLKPDVLFSFALREYLHRVGRVPKVLAGAAWHFIRHPRDLTPLSAVADLSTLVPAGLFDGAPLERFLAKAFAHRGRTNRFRDLDARLRVVATNVDTAEIVVFGKEGYDHVPLSKAVQASTALPAFYCPVKIDGAYYIDGVARRTVHASIALEEGVDLLFCINPIVPIRAMSEGGEAIPGGLVEYGLPSLLSQTFRTLVYSRMKTGFRSYDERYPDTDILLVEPELEDHRRFFANVFSFSNRHEVCEQAYATTLEHLRARREAVEAKLVPHGFRLRPDVLDDPERTLYPPPGRTRALQPVHDALDGLDRALGKLAALAG